jgi:hypothetical protein
MSLTDESGVNTTMLVSPAGNVGGYPVYMGGQNGNNGFGDGNGWWIVLLIILLAAGNGFGNNNGGNGGFFGGQPIVVNDGNGGAVQRGFDQAATIGAITGVQNGVQNLATQLCGCCGDIQTSLCNGFAGVNATVNSGFSQAEIANNARQIANMQQAFAGQTAMAQGFNQLGTQFADCCCENRLASADLKYTIATENCADRAAVGEGIRDILANQTANTQRILDQLCQDKIDAKNEKIADLERQLSMATLRESQTAQNAFIQQGFSDEVDQLYNRLSNCPVPTTPVYGRTPIFTCQNNGCGCGCGM